MTIEEANRLLISSLSDLYEEREAAAICSLVMENITGLTRSQRLLQKTEPLGAFKQDRFRQCLDELLQYRPVQYVLGEAWFGSLPFYVNEQVLIPRPETEELADWLLRDSNGAAAGTTTLDIGTGSGCIPVYLQSKRPDMNMVALDISEAALEIARRNGERNHSRIEFLAGDIRDPAQWPGLPQADWIISNPPYIPEKQKSFLDKHVRDFEPSLALFVPDEEPILFYKVIGEFAMDHLKKGGALFLEIHHDYAREIVDWYEKKGYIWELKKDLSGNNRMIKAWR